MSDGEASDGFDGAFDEEFGSWDGDDVDAASADQAEPDEKGKVNTEHPQEKLEHPPQVQRPSNHELPQRHAVPCASCFPLLPKEVLTRVLSFLSAQDLTTLSACNRLLHAAACEDLLWRRLFCARWGKPTQPEGGHAGWKGRYVDADCEEFHQTVLGAPEELRAVFSDMQRAKRQTCLGRALVDDLAQVPQCQRNIKLAEWRREKGFSEGPVARPNLARATLRFHRIEPDTFACEDTGWVHLCDHSCREGIIDAESGLITCPISGRTSLRLMAPHEELSMQQRSVDACFTAADQELQSYSRARAYTEGYYANAREMRVKYGVKLR